MIEIDIEDMIEIDIKDMIEIDISKGIEVGGLHYTIETSPKISKELSSRGNSGECDTQNLRIILGVLEEDHTRNTFIHECLEAVNVQYCNSRLEHNDLTNMANGLSQIFKSLGIAFVVSKK